jgi:uncharacterized membrane protein YqjE
VDLQAEPVARAGLAAALRSLGATLTGLVATRVELAVVELREEGERRKAMLVLASTAGAFLFVALLLATLFVLAVYWDTHRLAAIGSMTLLYLALGLGAIVRMRVLAANAPPPFEATLRELATDRELLGGRHE